MLGRISVGGVVLSTVVWSTGAWAQSTDEARAGARSAAIAGAAAMQEGRLEDAVDLFKRAETLMHAPTHLLYLARAQVKLGRLVRARENYLKIVREQLPPNAPRAFLDARTTAQTEAADLEGRIPIVKIVVEGDGARDATVTMDGQKLSSALAGLPFPIDPGEHQFHARTKTLQSETVAVTCTEGARETLTVSLPLTLAAPVEVEEAISAPVVAAPEPESASTERADTGGSRAPAFVALGIGAVGIVGGTVFMLQNRSKRSEADELCSGDKCPLSRRAEVEQLDNDASSAATLSWVGYGVGVAGIAAGAALWVLSSPKRGTSTRAQLRPILSASALGGFVGLGGAY
jgi:hypothetical protein